MREQERAAEMRDTEMLLADRIRHFLEFLCWILLVGSGIFRHFLPGFIGIDQEFLDIFCWVLLVLIRNF